MDPSAQALELLGVVLAGGAWLCSLATTMLTSWLTLSTELLPTEFYELGLWETCVIQEHGGLECRPYDGLLGLPPNIKLARIFMVLTLGAGLLGLLLAIPGLHVISCCSDLPDIRRRKRAMKAAGGALCLVAGVLGLVPVSYIAHLAVLNFHDETMPEMVPRWEFGDALFCGWAGGVLHLIGGVLLITSCLCQQRETLDPPEYFSQVRVRPGQSSFRSKTEYV
ncbi:putative claudin-24 [Xyrichtys novacula]|uniref:Claudin n=1 Tax=Xyrichtys novacula TaxID=13765 RepID=A0AAV1HLZ1_XYRNO|nr:putative claudin-24 [Xyrichtys novacula]